MKNKQVVLLAVGLQVGLGLASFSGNGTAFPLLTLSPGARSVSMATAGAEFAHQASALFYNPAGIAFVESPEATFEHNPIPWAVRTNYWNAAAVAPLSNQFSVGVFVSGVHYEWTGWGTGCNLSGGLSASYRPLRFLSAGINLKYNHTRIEWYDLELPSETVATDAGSVAADFGILADIPSAVGDFRGAVSGLHFGTLHTYRWPDGHTAGDTLPYTWRASAGYSICIRKLWAGAADLLPSGVARYRDWLLDNWRAELTYSVCEVEHGRPIQAAGLELKPLPVLAGRVGYFYAPDDDTASTDARRGWTWGIGLDFKFLRVDIARDAPLFYVPWHPQRLRYALAINIGEPLLRNGGLLATATRTQ